MIVDRTAFLAEFARRPLATGAIAPSGTALATLITAPVPLTGQPVVVELGPGTGAFTGAIQDRLAGRGHHLAIEINPGFAERLCRRYPTVDVVLADAGSLGQLLATRGHARVDAVVSGLPWAVFHPDRQDAILRAVAAGLADDGTFTTFAYRHAAWSPLARRLRRTLRALFEEVTIGRTVWANLPPAQVYQCRRPLRRHRPTASTGPGQAAGQSWVARRGETAPGGAASSQERNPVTVDCAMAISTGAW
jgi:phosphatidylethanolamine/phosphatidyl-N-methylethanolamine N-methyltransferase